jgi:Mlo family
MAWCCGAASCHTSLCGAERAVRLTANRSRNVSFGELSGAASTLKAASNAQLDIAGAAFPESVHPVQARSPDQSHPPGALDSVHRGCHNLSQWAHDMRHRRGKNRKRLLRIMRGHSERVKAWSDDDIRSLFWLNRPRLMLRVFQYAWFVNALSLAIIGFSFWQDDSMFSGVIGSKDGARSVSATIVAIVLLVVDLLLLAHAASFVLPVYALTALSVSFDSQASLLQFAKGQGIKPQLVHFLEDTEGQACFCCKLLVGSLAC